MLLMAIGSETSKTADSFGDPIDRSMMLMATEYYWLSSMFPPQQTAIGNNKTTI
jgi:hypothetical protein